MIKKFVYRKKHNGPTITVAYDDTEFEELYDDDIPEVNYLHYIGDGSRPIHNPEGNTRCWSMFAGFEGEHLNLSEFNTSNVEDMSNMFDYCENIECLDLSNFDTSNVTNMSAMFRQCTKLKELNLSNFNTSKVKYMNCMFEGCELLTNNPLKNVSMDSVINMEYMFSNCISFTKFNMTDFTNLNVVKNMECMFEGCENLKHVICNNITSPTVSFKGMFEDCENLSNIEFEYLGKYNVDGMFCGSKLDENGNEYGYSLLDYFGNTQLIYLIINEPSHIKLIMKTNSL